jgi:hypothetical protein
VEQAQAIFGVKPGTSNAAAEPACRSGCSKSPTVGALHSRIAGDVVLDVEQRARNSDLKYLSALTNSGDGTCCRQRCASR